MKEYLIPTIFIAILLSLVMSKIVYYGFTPNYAADIFSRKAFTHRFSHDVYKYRILTKYLLFKLDDWLVNDVPKKTDERILVHTPDGSNSFYEAFYYLNTIFLVLTSVILVLLLGNSSAFNLRGEEGVLMVFLALMLIAVTEYVVCCYDVSGYFFELLILYLYLKFFEKHYILTIIALCLLIGLSTMNRESSAMSVSMLSLLLVLRYGFSRRAIVSIALFAASFIMTYIALHHYIVDSTGIEIENVQAGQLLVDTNELGLLFWIIFFYLTQIMANGSENRRMILAFHLASLPYILTVFKDGVLWETRLYMPLFLGSLMLSKVDPAGHKVHLTSLVQRVTAFIYKSSPYTGHRR